MGPGIFVGGETAALHWLPAWLRHFGGGFYAAGRYVKKLPSTTHPLL